MFLFPLLICLPLFPLLESKQFLVELKSGKRKILETNNGKGTGIDAQQELSFQKNKAVKNISKPDHKKVKNAESTTESHLTTTPTDKIPKGNDYFLFGIVCFFMVCNSGKPSENKPTKPRPTKPPRTTKNPWYAIYGGGFP